MFPRKFRDPAHAATVGEGSPQLRCLIFRRRQGSLLLNDQSNRVLLALHRPPVVSFVLVERSQPRQSTSSVGGDREGAGERKHDGERENAVHGGVSPDWSDHPRAKPGARQGARTATQQFTRDDCSGAEAVMIGWSSVASAFGFVDESNVIASGIPTVGMS